MKADTEMKLKYDDKMKLKNDENKRKIFFPIYFFFSPNALLEVRKMMFNAVMLSVEWTSYSIRSHTEIQNESFARANENRTSRWLFILFSYFYVWYITQHTVEEMESKGKKRRERERTIDFGFICFLFILLMRKKQSSEKCRFAFLHSSLIRSEKKNNF